MKIDDNSYFIKYELRNGEEFARINHYGEVWENGYELEYYVINNDSIYYEDASFNGFSTSIDNCWKRILARNFNRWRDEINKSKQNLIDMGKKAGIEIVKELKAGDCVFITVPPYDPEDEYEEVEYSFLEVDSVDNDFVCGKIMLIETNYFDYRYEANTHKGDNYWIDYALENNNVVRIDKSVCYRAVEDLRRLITKLKSEIKKMV